MKRLLIGLTATALTIGVTVLAWGSQFVGRCPGKCPLCGP